MIFYSGIGKTLILGEKEKNDKNIINIIRI